MIRSTFAIRAAALAVIAVGGMTAAPAIAGNGCNGVVNIFVWGCAPWDNNNGNKYPYYRKKAVTMHAPKGARIEYKDGSAVLQINGQNYPVVNGAAGVVAAGGANVVASGGANVVAPGGANMQVWVPN